MTRILMANGRYCCAAVLTVALLVGSSPRAHAALYYWTEGEPAAYPLLPRHIHKQKTTRVRTQKSVKPDRESAKPQGPLIIAISISQQKLRLYDANGFFAESPVSTGMRGHSTPMGVFSVIQKQKYHRSNIYSNAPMPYMQRITWSGVAMHAGVLPGYPASHGCIRMPMAFAVKMWSWTRMGARVVVTPGEMTPASFSHALLPALRVAQQSTEPETNNPVGAKSDKGAPNAKGANADTKFELRATIGHRDDATPTADDAAPPLRAQMQTADASGEAPASKATMSDAAPASAAATSEADVAETATDAKAPPADQAAAKPDQASAPAKANDDTAKAGETQSASGKSEDKPADAKDINPAEKATSRKVEGAKPDDAKKDQSRLLDSKHDIPKHGQIAVFISRKDSKLYVRQNFEPLFETPVTIAPSDRPLGTHVFTAEVDKADSNVLRWSVVSLPVSIRSAMQGDDEERPARRRKGVAEAKQPPVPDSAAEALDRISVPADTMARIADALTSGASIIVSDQGINQGETGEGTDFIVSLR